MNSDFPAGDLRPSFLSHYLPIDLNLPRLKSTLNENGRRRDGADRPNEYARPGIVFQPRTFIRKSSITTRVVGARNQRLHL